MNADDGGWYMIGAICLLIYGAGYVIVTVAQDHMSVLKTALWALAWGGVAASMLGIIGGIIWANFLGPWYEHRKAVRKLQRETTEDIQQERDSVRETERKMRTATTELDDAINEINKRWGN